MSDLVAVVDPANSTTKRKCGRAWYEIAPAFAAELMSRLGRLEGIAALDAQGLVGESDFYDRVHLRKDAHRRLAVSLAPVVGSSA